MIPVAPTCAASSTTGAPSPAPATRHRGAATSGAASAAGPSGVGERPVVAMDPAGVITAEYGRRTCTVTAVQLPAHPRPSVILIDHQGRRAWPPRVAIAHPARNFAEAARVAAAVLVCRGRMRPCVCRGTCPETRSGRASSSAAAAPTEPSTIAGASIAGHPIGRGHDRPAHPYRVRRMRPITAPYRTSATRSRCWPTTAGVGPVTPETLVDDIAHALIESGRGASARGTASPVTARIPSCAGAGHGPRLRSSPSSSASTAWR